MLIDLPRYIEVETSRYCNRKCGWCANGASDSRRVQELMVWEMFTGLLTELSSLQFTDWLALHNYNEPLANPRLLRELDAISMLLPSCRLSIFTNGDMLDTRRLTEFVAKRVEYLRVTLYPPAGDAHVAPTEDRIRAWLRAKRLHEAFSWAFGPVRQGLAATAQLGPLLKVEVITPDLSRYNWRGGTAPAFATGERTTPCFMTSHSASIDYRGRLKMCCNVYPDAPGHEEHVIGSLQSSSFQMLWESQRLQVLRKAHAKADWMGSRLCSRCGQSLPAHQVVQIRTRLQGEVNYD